MQLGAATPVGVGWGGVGIRKWRDESSPSGVCN